MEVRCRRADVEAWGYLGDRVAFRSRYRRGGIELWKSRGAVGVVT